MTKKFNQNTLLFANINILSYLFFPINIFSSVTKHSKTFSKKHEFVIPSTPKEAELTALD